MSTGKDILLAILGSIANRILSTKLTGSKRPKFSSRLVEDLVIERIERVDKSREVVEHQRDYRGELHPVKRWDRREAVYIVTTDRRVFTVPERYHVAILPFTTGDKVTIDSVDQYGVRVVEGMVLREKVEVEATE